MFSLQESQLLAECARKVGFSHRVLSQKYHAQKMVCSLNIDLECSFTWEFIDDGDYFLITSFPGVHARTDSQFVASFNNTLPYFEKWLTSLKEAFSTVHRYYFYHDENSTDEPLLTFSLDHKQELTKTQRWGLWRIIIRAMEIVECADMTAESKQEVMDALTSLRQTLGKRPQSAAHYLLVGLLKTNGSLYPALTEPFEELAFAIIERVKPVQ